VKYYETDEFTKDANVAFINRRWTQLHSLDKDWHERALNFLFLIHTGGSIATLGFIGSLGNSCPIGIKIALALFVMGIITVGILTAKAVHHMSSLFAGWKRGVQEYYADKKDWDALLKEDDQRVGTNIWNWIIGYMAFAFFIIGVIIGGCSLFYYQYGV